jgi:hypothetical protein
VILDLVWAIRELRQVKVKPKRVMKALAKIFGLEHPSWQIQRILESAMTKEFRTYFFDRRPRGVVVRDISSLDPGDADEAIAGWGGLSGFSGQIAQIVGEAISEETA